MQLAALLQPAANQLQLLAVIAPLLVLTAVLLSQLQKATRTLRLQKLLQKLLQLPKFACDRSKFPNGKRLLQHVN